MNNQITINGRTFTYEVFDCSSEWGDVYETCFYEGTETIMVRTGFLGLFGPKKQVEQPKKVFTINWDANDPSITKSEWKKIIEHKIELLDRKEQLERGELI